MYPSSRFGCGGLVSHPRARRFITSVERTSTVAMAKEFVASIRHEMPDATHHAVGWRIDDSGALSVRGGATRTLPVLRGVLSLCVSNCVMMNVHRRWQHCDDDREVKGTAGPPILARLDGEDLVQTAVVVTRYYGGTRLGRGGLVRAYGAAASAGLQAAGVLEVRVFVLIKAVLCISVQLIQNETGCCSNERAWVFCVCVRVFVFRCQSPLCAMHHAPCAMRHQIVETSTLRIVVSHGLVGRVRGLVQRLGGSIDTVEFEDTPDTSVDGYHAVELTLLDTSKVPTLTQTRTPPTVLIPPVAVVSNCGFVVMQCCLPQGAAVEAQFMQSLSEFGMAVR